MGHPTSMAKLGRATRPVAHSHGLERIFEQIAGTGRAQMRRAMVTAERDEVQAAALLESF